MKKSLILAIIFGFSYIPSLCMGSKEMEIKYEIYNKKEFYYKHQPIWFKLTLINTSGKELWIQPPRWTTLNLKILNKKTGKQLKKHPQFGFDLFVLEPHDLRNWKKLGFRLQSDDSIIDFIQPTSVFYPDIVTPGKYLLKKISFSTTVPIWTPWKGSVSKEINTETQTIEATGKEKEAFDLWREAGKKQGKEAEHCCEKLFSLYPESPYTCKAYFEYAKKNKGKIGEFIERYPDSPYILELLKEVPKENLKNLKRKYSDNSFVNLLNEDSPYLLCYQRKWRIIARNEEKK